MNAKSRTVSAVRYPAFLARKVQLGEAARAKSSGDFSVVISGGTKDVDLVHGRNNLGIAAKVKATGGSISSRNIQLAPLK
jgi:hypothetical protein